MGPLIGHPRSSYCLPENIPNERGECYKFHRSLLSSFMDSFRGVFFDFLVVLVLLHVLLCWSLVHAGPVLLSPEYTRGPVTLARNIRHLPCISRRTGDEGVCMFAIDCLKANGSHLGTCIDRFYFGSCCQIPDKTVLPTIIGNNIEDNSIDSSSFVHPHTENRIREPTTEKNVADKLTTAGNVESKTELGSTLDNKIDSDVKTQTTTSPETEKTTKRTDAVTEIPLRLSTFQSVSGISNSVTENMEKPVEVSTEAKKPITTTTQKPLATRKPIRPTKPTYKPRPSYKPSNFSRPQYSTPPPRPSNFTTKPKPIKPANSFNTTRKPIYRPPPKRPTSTKKPLPSPPRLNITILPQSTSSRPVFTRPSAVVITYINTTTDEKTTTTVVPLTALPEIIEATTKSTTEPLATETTQKTTTEKILDPVTSSTTTRSILKPIDVSTELPPGLVTWSSNVVDSATKGPESDKPEKTTVSEDIWSPITPPEGWILISTVPPKPQSSSTSSSTTTTTTTEESSSTLQESSPTQSESLVTTTEKQIEKLETNERETEKPLYTTTTDKLVEQISEITPPKEVNQIEDSGQENKLKPVAEVPKPVEIETAKPEVEEQKPAVQEPEKEISLPVTEEAKPVIPEAKPEIETETLRPEIQETKPVVNDMEPEKPEFKPTVDDFITETKPDTKPDIEEAKPEILESKPEILEEVDVTTPGVVNTVPDLQDNKPELEESKPTKPDFTETKPAEVEPKPDIVEEDQKQPEIIQTSQEPISESETPTEIVEEKPESLKPIPETPVQEVTEPDQEEPKPEITVQEEPKPETEKPEEPNPTDQPTEQTTFEPTTIGQTQTYVPTYIEVSNSHMTTTEGNLEKLTTKPTMVEEATDKPDKTTIPEFTVHVTLTPPVPSEGLSTFSSVSSESVTPSLVTDGVNVSSTESPAATNVTESSSSSTSSPLNDTSSSTVSTTTAEPFNMTNYKEVCGRRLWPEARIVGGAKSGFGRWPWQISLRQWRTSTYLHKCGAALLNENWAITAAHCVEHVPPSELLVRLGEHDLANEEEPYGFAERRVQIVASHPHFDPATFEYDLALLRFYEPVNFQPNILPVCVPDDDDNFVGKTAHVTGWGRLYDEGPLPSVLQEVEVPVINNTACEAMYQAAGYNEHIPHIFICAGWRKGGADSCEGDSGGPMVVQRERDKRFVLGGVISWGIGCAEPNQPGVYTRISEFRDWINQILQF